ncbi:2-phosphosulfolactate phosphatase [Kosakonia sp.]|uniref:2-phosphosulfolactate phosphatase n=1 Tax=Kosakonia sp. TaxID=1916651 RepID=UPI00289F4D3C|nr:2-phosphosulfolactate phosphatase [Kosakonia sp.]
MNETWYQQSRFDVRLEWGQNAAKQLARHVDCVVIVDVMSFSSCVSIANDNQAHIYPWPWKDESARRFAQENGADVASFTRTFAGDRYTLSPASLLTIPAGHRLVLPSPNGSTLSFQARDCGAAVFSGCFRNRAATARACAAFKHIVVIPAGERWPDGSLRPALEDHLAAGAIIAALGRESMSPEARAAMAAFNACRQEDLYHCSSANELVARGFADDVALCLATDVSPYACRLSDGCYQPV